MWIASGVSSGRMREIDGPRPGDADPGGATHAPIASRTTAMLKTSIDLGICGRPRRPGRLSAAIGAGAGWLKGAGPRVESRRRGTAARWPHLTHVNKRHKMLTMGERGQEDRGGHEGHQGEAARHLGWPEGRTRGGRKRVVLGTDVPGPPKRASPPDMR